MIFFCEFATSDVDGAVGKDENSTPASKRRVSEESRSGASSIRETNLVRTFRRFEPAGERSSSRRRNTDFLVGSNATGVETVEEASSPLEEPVVVDERILHDLSHEDESSNKTFEFTSSHLGRKNVRELEAGLLCKFNSLFCVVSCSPR